MLTPEDRLSLYLAPWIRERFRLGSCYTIFDGAEMKGAFKARRRGNGLLIETFIGEEREWETLEEFSRRRGLVLSEAPSGGGEEGTENENT